ncbi:MAG: DUF1801 domain-containing protein [Candidatus Pacebacteria bacterium]|nr:DUF1801 domain-containing protein [Candidatus Paceibacterota bacterium]
MTKALPQLHADIEKYHTKLSPSDRAVCDVLSAEIMRHLKGAENKVWHAHPVWFLDGNPVVGYSALKGGVRLLFWSGQSFDEEGLKPEGSFKAAEMRYSDASQVVKKDLKRWLKQAKDIQWDYKNIVKMNGFLKKVVPAKKKVAK